MTQLVSFERVNFSLKLLPFFVSRHYRVLRVGVSPVDCRTPEASGDGKQTVLRW